MQSALTGGRGWKDSFATWAPFGLHLALQTAPQAPLELQFVLQTGLQAPLGVHFALQTGLQALLGVHLALQTGLQAPLGLHFALQTGLQVLLFAYCYSRLRYLFRRRRDLRKTTEKHRILHVLCISAFVRALQESIDSRIECAFRATHATESFRMTTFSVFETLKWSPRCLRGASEGLL